MYLTDTSKKLIVVVSYLSFPDMYTIDVLSGQTIKLIQVGSTSELHENWLKKAPTFFQDLTGTYGRLYVFFSSEALQ